MALVAETLHQRLSPSMMIAAPPIMSDCKARQSRGQLSRATSDSQAYLDIDPSR